MDIATSTFPSDASNNPQNQLTKLPQAKDLAKSKDLLDDLYTALKTCVKYNKKRHLHRGWGKAAEKLFDGVWKDKFQTPNYSPSQILRSRVNTLHGLFTEDCLNHDELCEWLKEWKEQITEDESMNPGEYTPSAEEIVKDKRLLKIFISVLVKHVVERDEEKGGYKGWVLALNELFSHELWNKFKKPNLVRSMLFFSTRSKRIHNILQRDSISIPQEFDRWVKDWSNWKEQKDGINEDQAPPVVRKKRSSSNKMTGYGTDESESSSDDEFVPDDEFKPVRRRPRVTQKKRRSVTTTGQENSTQTSTSDLDLDSESDLENYKSPFNRKKTRNSSELNNEKCKTNNVIDLIDSDSEQEDLQQPGEQVAKRQRTYGSSTEKIVTTPEQKIKQEEEEMEVHKQEDLQQPGEQVAKRQRTYGSSTEKIVTTPEQKIKQEEDEMEVHKLRQLHEQALFNQRLIETKDKDKEQQQRMVELNESEITNHLKMIKSLEESLKSERESHLKKTKSLQDKIQSHMDGVESHQTKKRNAQSKIEEIDSDINGLKQSVEKAES